MSLVAWGLRFAGRGAWNELDRATRSPRAVQLRLLDRILSGARQTSFGRDFGLDGVRSLEDYGSAVPVADYERLRPYVDRLMDGDFGALTQERPRLFNVTSGTTGQPKLLPITPSHARANVRLSRAWLYRAVVDHPLAFEGALLPIVSPEVERYTPSGIPCGSASGRIYRDTPWVARRAYAVPYEVFAIKDFEAKYYAMARVASEARVTFVGTPNPSTLLRLGVVADRHWERLIRDVADGTLSSDMAIDPHVRAGLASWLRPNGERARQLEGAVTLHGALRFSDLWPDLRLVGCWTGGSVGVQLERARPWFGADVPTRDLGYLASEAHMTVPIHDRGAAGVLAVTACFFEFVPESEIEQEAPPTFLCDELEVGQAYYPVLSTQSGLYRYDINDVVRVTGFHNRTPMIEFLRKGRDMTSIGGEKLHVSQVVEAVERAQRELGLISVHYRAVACAEQNRYVLLTEWDEPPPLTALATFLADVDRALGSLNAEYESKRASGRLDPPELYVMQSGWRERSYLRRIAAGARDAQFKETLLSSSFDERDLEDVAQTIRLPGAEP